MSAFDGIKSRIEHRKHNVDVTIAVVVSIPKNKKIGVELDKSLNKLERIGRIETVDIDYNGEY